MECINPTCGKAITQPEEHSHQLKIYCSAKCAREDKGRYTWHANTFRRAEQKVKKEKGIFKYRDDEECGVDPPLPIETAYVNYCIRCDPPTYDFEDWYDLHLTFGGIDW